MGRQGNAPRPKNVECRLRGAVLTDCGAGRDMTGVVSRHIRYQQCQQLGRMAGSCQLPTFHPTEVFAHDVHFINRRTRGQQRTVHGHFVVECQTLARGTQQGRPAARDKRDGQII